MRCARALGGEGVGELEREGASMGEVVVGRGRGRDAGCRWRESERLVGNGAEPAREVVFPRDRYVLAGFWMIMRCGGGRDGDFGRRCRGGGASRGAVAGQGDGVEGAWRADWNGEAGGGGSHEACLSRRGIRRASSSSRLGTVHPGARSRPED